MCSQHTIIVFKNDGSALDKLFSVFFFFDRLYKFIIELFVVSFFYLRHLNTALSSPIRIRARHPILCALHYNTIRVYG